MRSNVGAGDQVQQTGLASEGRALLIAACSQATLAARLTQIAGARPGLQLAVVLGSRQALCEGSAAALAAAANAGTIRVGSRFVPSGRLIRALRRRGFETVLVLADEGRSPSRWGQIIGLLAGARRVYVARQGMPDPIPVKSRNILASAARRTARKLSRFVRRALPTVPRMTPIEMAASAYQHLASPIRPCTALTDARVLLIGSSPGATTRYRIGHKREHLRMLGVPVRMRNAWEYRANPLLAAADAHHHHLAIVHRLHCPGPTDGVLWALSRNKRPIVYDIDDLIFDPASASWVLPADQAAVPAQAKLLSQCTHVIAATAELAQRFGSDRRPVNVVQNVLSQEVLRLSEEARLGRVPHDGIRLGYLSGTPTHDRDLAGIAPALVEILRQHVEVCLVLIGPITVPGQLAEFGTRVQALPLVPWRELPGLAAGIDINLAPLDIDSPFCRCKSELKYVEAGALGIPTVATATPPFQTAITHGVNGLLAVTCEEWIAALDSLVTDPRGAQAMGEAARLDVAARYGPDSGARQLASAITSILAL